jgi:hypothetical protein
MPMPKQGDASVARDLDVDDSYTLVMILGTARRHGRGIQRLPDRTDRGRRVAAVQVETDEQARELLAALDRDGRRFYLDVERKQDLHLMAVAGETVRRGSYAAVKPNDTTVDAFEAVLVERHGRDLTDLVVAVNGSGNLAFKFALRMAESGCQVSMHGRHADKVALLVEAINEVLPRYSPHPVALSAPVGAVDVLVSAVTAEHVVGEEWLRFLAPGALCLDVGINNFAPAFIERAQQAGYTCARLDVRSAGDPLPVEPNPFFERIAGSRHLAGAQMVAGGKIGRRGDVVVDQVQDPTRVIGVANGTGGLLPEEDWSHEIRDRVAAARRVTAVSVRRRKGGVASEPSHEGE